MESLNCPGKLPINRGSSYSAHASENFEKTGCLAIYGCIGCLLGTPQSVPGFLEHQKRERTLKAFAEDKINKVYSLKEMEIPLRKTGVIKEDLVKEGLKFIRREHKGEKIYYVVNHNQKKIQGFVSLGVPTKEVLIMDPLTGKTGKAITKHQSEITKVKLSLPSEQASSLKLLAGSTHQNGNITSCQKTPTRSPVNGTLN